MGVVEVLILSCDELIDGLLPAVGLVFLAVDLDQAVEDPPLRRAGQGLFEPALGLIELPVLQRMQAELGDDDGIAAAVVLLPGVGLGLGLLPLRFDQRRTAQRRIWVEPEQVVGRDPPLLFVHELRSLDLARERTQVGMLPADLLDLHGEVGDEVAERDEDVVRLRLEIGQLERSELLRGVGAREALGGALDVGFIGVIGHQGEGLGGEVGVVGRQAIREEMEPAADDQEPDLAELAGEYAPGQVGGIVSRGGD